MKAIPLLVAAVATLSAPVQADFITGQVVDSQGVGVPGVDIDVKNLAGGGDPPIFNDGTDANGFFNTTVPDGFYRVTFTPPPPPTSTHLITEVDDVIVVGTTNMGVIQLPPGVALSGTLQDTGALPVAGVNIDVIDEATGDNLDLVGDQSDAFGAFAVAVPESSLEVRFNTIPTGQMLAPTALNVSPTGDTDLGTIILQPGFTLQAHVEDAGGSPVEGADTDTFDVATGSKLYTPADNTDGDGDVSVLVPAGTYDFLVCPALADQLVTGVVANVVVGGNVDLGLQTLQAGHIVSGTVVDGGGQPVPGVDIDIEDSITSAQLPTCDDNTNGSGQYAVVVPTGTWDVEFDPPFALPFSQAKQTGVSVTGPTIVNATVPDCPFHIAYGTGFAGSGGFVPQYTSSGGTPRLGNVNYALDLSNGLGGATWYFLLGVVPGAFPFKKGTLLIDFTFPTVVIPLPLLGTPGVPGAGFLSVPFPIPPEPALVGASLYFQAVVQDPGAQKGFAMSNGVQVPFCD